VSHVPRHVLVCHRSANTVDGWGCRYVHTQVGFVGGPQDDGSG
jgi:hypothetical protein